MSVGLKKYFNGNFPWRWESRNRSSMADISAEHFFLFFFWLRVRRHLFRKLGAEKVAGLEQIKKKLFTCTDKTKFTCTI